MYKFGRSKPENHKKMLSNTSKYAIRAVIYLALNAGEDKKIGIKQISKDLNIPTPFLGKILQTLAKQKLLSSTKGPHGGFGLGKSAEEIALIDIVDIIDGQDIFNKCLIRLEDCNSKEPCSMHFKYVEIRKSLLTLFKKEKVSELVDEIREGEKKLNL
ncbi:MAG: Rrf2 family transcriptional regulator [Bacteroidales bacterium]|nr:Rrf2 family transcriptional regulator [Bacteroidales bacterium]